MEYVKWLTWCLSVLGLGISAYAGILLFQGTPTIDDSFDVMVTTGVVPVPLMQGGENLSNTYQRAMSRQNELRTKSRRGVKWLIIGFIVQGIAVLGQMP